MVISASDFNIQYTKMTTSFSCNEPFNCTTIQTINQAQENRNEIEKKHEKEKKNSWQQKPRNRRRMSHIEEKLQAKNKSTEERIVEAESAQIKQEQQVEEKDSDENIEAYLERNPSTLIAKSC